MVEFTDISDKKVDVDPRAVEMLRRDKVDLGCNGDGEMSVTKISMRGGGLVTVALPTEQVKSLLQLTTDEQGKVIN